ncbi:DUF3973 domain-containing protein [Paenibacillus xerothermodurans]|uniref:DUF3973 domain-containing protein n=1 Tax=Paenibacillus xerothermodurans TaxID=1977292 RepID=A0A2W1NKI4_PAEXE|nr:hypothetical protein CBW46_017745 [Paenibacillus xerothermodurans]
MYYCIQCAAIHAANGSDKEIIFQSGFHYVAGQRYHAGVCQLEVHVPEIQHTTHTTATA